MDDDYVDNLLAENLTLKTKLNSKCEALLILNREITNLKHERDYLREVLEEMKLKQAAVEVEIHSTDARALRVEVDTLRQKLRDALGDVQALRSTKPQSRNEEDKVDTNVSQREQDLVEQLEKIRLTNMQLESDLQSVLDEKEELITERDAYKCKLHRLNHECNVLLKGSGNGIIDLDALVMENRFLQEKLIQAQEESQLAKQVSDRYKCMLQSKKQKSKADGDGNAGVGMLLSQKQVKELLESCGRTDIPGTDASFSDLRSLCLALLDSLGDKTLALTHQKRANRILAARIAELQSRLESVQSKQAVMSPSSFLLEGYRTINDRSETSSSSPSDVGYSDKSRNTPQSPVQNEPLPKSV